MKLGYAPLMYAPTEYSRAFNDIAACRYDAVDLVLGKIRTARFEAVARELRVTGLAPRCVMAGWVDSPTTVETILDSLSAVADLGATTLGLIPPQRHTVEEATFHDWLETIVHRSRGHGLTPIVHHHAGSIIDTPEKIERVLETHDVGLLFDTAHYHLYDNCETGIRRFANRIEHVHLKDLDPGVPPDYFQACIDELSTRHPNFDSIVTVYRGFADLGQGEISFESVIKRLGNSGYDRVVTVEVENQRHDPLVHAKRNADVARRCIDL